MEIVLSSSNPPASRHVLVIDDDDDVRQAASLLLGRHGYTVDEAADAYAARSHLAAAGADLVLLDLNLRQGATSGEDGLALLAELLSRRPDLPVVVVTAHSGVNIAVRAIRAGAIDFVTKPWSNARLLATLDAALAGRRREAASGGAEDGAVLIGEGEAMARTRAMIARVAPTEASVFVHGGPGSGKSLIARLIHQASPRAAGPFVPVDLNALDLEAAEGSLFGGAVQDQAGALADAKGGVLVLDEIDALAPRTQARLLAALQRGAVAATPNGVRVPVDVRLVALSRRPAEALAGFNRELLHRLTTVELVASGLGGAGDIEALTAHFLRLYALRHGRPERALSPAAQDWLAAAPWPEAVRDLSRALERAVLLADGPVIGLEDLAPVHQGQQHIDAPRLADSEKALLAAALKRANFNVSRAAEALGLTRQALYRRMARHGL